MKQLLQLSDMGYRSITGAKQFLQLSNMGYRYSNVEDLKFIENDGFFNDYLYIIDHLM